MNSSLVTLTIGQSPGRDVMPLLLEYLPADRIDYVGLLDGMTLQQIEETFSAAAGEKVLITRLNDGCEVRLSAAKAQRGLQQRIHALENEGYETILLLSNGEFDGLHASQAVLLEPDRIVPPLIEAIVEGHQVGIVVPLAEQVNQHHPKWKNLSRSPVFAAASPFHSGDSSLMEAALQLQEQGADVLVLDYEGYQRRHRDYLQRLLGIPVILSNVLVAQLAAELIM